MDDSAVFVVAADPSVIGLGVVLFVAALAILVANRLRQPMVLGYLVAGLLVGPHGPLPWRLVGLEHVNAMASLAIVFIMLYIGMEFSPRRLRQLGAAPLVVALLQMLVMFLVGRTVAQWIGMDPMEALFVGIALSISSTIVAIKILDERGELRSSHGRLVVGVLLVQDVVAVLFLALIGGIAVSGAVRLGEVTPVFVGMAAFAVAALVVGALVVPRLVDMIGHSRELLLVVILGLAFGVALLADHFAFSVALGAFLVGAVVAESRVVADAERLVVPLKHMFTAVFFVAIGMLIDPAVLLSEWRFVLGFSVLLIAVRLVAHALPSFLFGQPPSSAMRGSAALAQIGEFSFIILTSGIAAGLVEARLLTLFVGIAAVTTLATPYLIMVSPALVKGLAKVTPPSLRTYGELYTGWAQRLGDEEETHKHRRREFALLRRILMNGALLLALGGVAYVLVLSFSTTMVPVFDWRIPVVWLVLPLVGVVMIPFLVTLWSALREIAMEMILELVPDRVVMQEEPPVALKVVRASLGLVLAFAAALLAVALLPETGPATLAGGAAAVVVVVVAAALLWRQVRSLHLTVEETMEDLFGAARTREERDEVMRLIGRHYKVSLETVTVDVPPASPVAHRQIRDAQLRNRTGATVVSVKRGRQQWANPPPSMLILPRDRLLLMGEPVHLEKARSFITRREKAQVPSPAAVGEVNVRELELAEDSEAVGHTLSGIALRERTGASIVAVLRDHTHIQNPSPNVTLEPRDRLFLIGTDRQVDDAVALLSRRKEPGEDEGQRVTDAFGGAGDDQTAA